MRARMDSLKLLLAVLSFALGVLRVGAEEPARRLVLVHYMPWFEAKPFSAAWGWHWTMNAVDPEKGKIAAHFNPLIGPYDSGDPAVLENHLLTMKLAGADGVIVDWYGLQDFRDYALLHRNTRLLVEHAEKFGMKFAICYEDQTVPFLVEAGRVAATNRAAHVAAEIAWLATNWFARPGHVRIGGDPVLLSFGVSGLSDAEWSQCLAAAKIRVAYFSQQVRRTAAIGAFDWPLPEFGRGAITNFAASARGWPHSIPVAFPRFVDFYAEAKVPGAHKRIADDEGATFRTTLESAMKSGAPLIQIATWNDWGEGTMIEPSREYGFRDLEVLQEMRRRHIETNFTATAADLGLPGRLLALRRAAKPDARQLDEVAALIAAGKRVPAHARLAELEQAGTSAGLRAKPSL